MTRRTQVILIDDLDGTEADVQPVQLALDGQQYEIDLGPANRERLQEALQPFLAASRRVKRRRQPRTK